MNCKSLSLDFITPEMIEFSIARLKSHVRLVDQIYQFFLSELNFEVERNSVLKTHDQSKFKDPELYPYIIINWEYKLKSDGNFQGLRIFDNEELNRCKNLATLHHIKNNPHHPEYWDKDFSEAKFNLLNRDDIPKEPVNATSMGKEFIIEMVADWCAVSIERNSSVRKWFLKNNGSRWLFNQKQQGFISVLIDTFESKFIL